MSFKLILPLLTLLITIFFILSCAPRESPPTDLARKESIQPVEETKQGWEADWERTLQSARKEGKVVIYTVASLGPTYKSMAPIVKNKFGFEVEVVSFGRGGEQSAKLITERRAGIFMADVTSTGMNTFFGDLEPAGIPSPMEPVLILPEILDKKNWYGGEIHWGNEQRTVLHLLAYPSPVLARNTDLVKKEELVSYYDLLNPKWKGKIIMNDPSMAGTGIKSFSVLGWHILNLDFFRQLVKQEPVIIQDQRLQVDWLAKGKFSILFFPRSAPMNEYKEAGAPLAYVQAKEGSYLSRDGGATSLADRASNPNAAKIFLNFIFSKEGMTLISRGFEGQSARVDVPSEFLGPDRIIQPGIYYFTEADSKEWIARDSEYKKFAVEIFGHLIR